MVDEKRLHVMQRKYGVVSYFVDDDFREQVFYASRTKRKLWMECVMQRVGVKNHHRLHFVVTPIIDYKILKRLPRENDDT